MINLNNTGIYHKDTGQLTDVMKRLVNWAKKIRIKRIIGQGFILGLGEGIGLGLRLGLQKVRARARARAGVTFGI